MKVAKIIPAAVLVFALHAMCIGRTVTVDDNGPADFASIQAAIDAPGTVDGDQIQTAPGIYYETVDFKGKAVRLYGRDGRAVTIIDGQNVRRGVQCVSGEDPDTVLEGFTIRNGYADQGAGMYNENSRPTIRECTFSYNTAGAGGGMYNLNSSPVVTNCTFDSNRTPAGKNGTYGSIHGTDSGSGGGMYNFQSLPILIHCIFVNNRTGDGGDGYNGSGNENGGNAGHGGGIFNDQSDAEYTECRFINNQTGMGGTGGDRGLSGDYAGRGKSGGSGGGVYSVHCSSVFTRCDFTENATGKGAKGGHYTESANSGNGGDGAGMYNSDSFIAISDCNFVSNRTGEGGIGTRGLYAIMKDAGGGGNGAGVYDSNSIVTATSCRFNENLTGRGGACLQDIDGTGGGTSGTGGHGAGIYQDKGSLTATQCVFQSNKTGDGGRAGSAYPQPIDKGENGSSGGPGGSGTGIYNFNCEATIIACRFIENATGNGASGGNGGSTASVFFPGGDGGDGGSGGHGAGICNITNALAAVKNCVFIRNTAGSGGAKGLGGYGAFGSYGHDGTPGKAGYSGIATIGSGAAVTNCTFLDNHSPGVLYNLNSNSIITNSILWDIQSPEVINDSCAPVLTYCDVRDGTTQAWFGLGCIDQYPSFADNQGRIPTYSPCVGAGNNEAAGLTEFDLDGNPRIFGDRVDMGAYECALLPVHNVTTDQKYQKIQWAVDEANAGDQIRVMPGLYLEAIDFKGKAIHLQSSHGPEVTTIDGSGHYHTVQCVSGEGPGTVLDGFTITGGRADGGLDEDFNDGNYTNWMVFDEGNQYGPSAWSAVTGAMKQTSNFCTYPYDVPAFRGTYALWKYGSAWTNYEISARMRSEDNDIIGIMFRYQDANNYYRVSWGRDHYTKLVLGKMKDGQYTILTELNGAYAAYAWYNVKIRAVGPEIKVYINSELKLSATDSDPEYFDSGSIALYCWGNDQTFFDDISVRLTDSSTQDTFGGGMYNQNSSPTVTNCIFTGNGALEYGGGMANSQSSPVVTNCVFRQNFVFSDTVSFGGGMFNHYGANPTVTHCTFIDNSGPCGGGAICNWSGTGATVTNCILWGNHGTGTPSTDEVWIFGTINLTSSLVEQGAGQSWFGAGCIDAEPMFADSSGRLLPESPCIDAGSNSAPGLPLRDFDGHPRIIDGNCSGTAEAEMGAFEFNYADRGDFNYNCQVDLPNVLLLGESWLTRPNDPAWNRFYNISEPEDEWINLRDLCKLAENWLMMM